MTYATDGIPEAVSCISDSGHDITEALLLLGSLKDLKTGQYHSL
jgi:hypothetical protein